MSRFSVIIAGGGVAALEALLRLRRLAGDRVEVTVLAPNDVFVYRALSLAEPFSVGTSELHSVPAVIGHADAEWVRDTLRSVEVDRGIVHTGSAQELSFDALLVAVGAHPHAVVPHAETFDDREADALLRGLVDDIREGNARRLAFVNPSGPVWPLPLYELALLAAHSGRRAAIDDLRIDLITAEPQPLPAFGAAVGAEVARLLASAGIGFRPSTEPRVPRRGHIVVPDRGELDVDRLIAMPRLCGPSVAGVPGGGLHGFIPADRHCAVPGTRHTVFAAGDALDFPLKHGGVGAQAADVAAAAIAHQAGADVAVPPFHPEVHGKLFTGAGPKFLSSRYVGGQGFASNIDDQPRGGSSHKVTAAELAPYLERTPSVAQA